MAARPDSADFRAIFLADTPLIDTRAPVEFAEGTFPCAINLPLMSDAEREAVGTCYHREGQEAAIRLGHSLVCGAVKEERVAAWLEFVRAHPEGYLYCFRGGLRSAISQQWLREASVDYPRITGGYKAMRHFLVETVESASREASWRVLAGQTGCGKTELLEQIPASIDLEGMACHRGSSFGKRASGQPPQITFENALGIAILRARERFVHRPLVVEDESHLIGRCLIPNPLRETMVHSPVVVVEVTLEERLERTHRSYILGQLEEWQALLGEEAGFIRFADDLRQSLANIRNRLGGVRYGELQKELEDALARHSRGDSDAHKGWIHSLLVDYYDPMYSYQLSKKEGRVIFRGSASAVVEFFHHTASG